MKLINERRMYIVLMLIMMIVLTSCTSKDYIEIDDENIIELSEWHFSSGIPNNTIIFHDVGGHSASFECFVDSGQFSFNEIENDELTINSGDIIHWNSTSDIENAFISIIIIIENNISGYAVIKIDQISGPADYTASIIKCVYYQKADDEYQDVSRSFIEKKIEEIITDNGGRTNAISEESFFI